MRTLEHTGHGWHPAQTARYQSDFGDTGGSALTRGPAHARVGRVIAPSAPSLPQSSWLPARSAERWSCPWSGRWRTRTREAARPHAHAPARPRFPCSHLGACAAEGAPGRRRKPSARSRQTAGPSIFFFPTVWNRMFDGWSRSEGARQKTHQPSAVTVACSDSA